MINLKTIIFMGKTLLGITDKQIYFVAGGGCCGSFVLGLWLWSWFFPVSIILFLNTAFWFYIGVYT